MTEPRYTKDDLLALLAPTLGDERARELVGAALEDLGVLDPTFPAREVVRALELIGATRGFVGSVARFALARFTLSDATAGSVTPPWNRPAAATADPGATTMSQELATLLAPALGEEKSTEAIAEAVRRRGLSREHLTFAQALEVLEDLAAEEGLVGVSARFTKARLLMRSPKEGPQKP